MRLLRANLPPNQSGIGHVTRADPDVGEQGDHDAKIDFDSIYYGCAIVDKQAY